MSTVIAVSTPPPLETSNGPVDPADLDRVVNAAVRAAVAWTMQQTEPRAWRELARMTGVVRHALGPNTTLDGPMDPDRVPAPSTA